MFTMSESKTQVTFVQNEIPPLEPGHYTITVKQEVKLDNDSNDADKNFTITRRFAVAGERFQFDPSEIASVFPPDQADGEFYGILPYVVFNRRTLPWERQSLLPDKGTESDKAPWLCILLINEDELYYSYANSDCKIEPHNRTVIDLIEEGKDVYGSGVTDKGQLPAHFISYPNINRLGYGERPDDRCMTIDIPLDLFNKIAPCKDDLPHLAHARILDTTNTEDLPKSSSINTGLPTIECSLVMGNRIANSNNKTNADESKSYVFLVSIENMGEYLPGFEGTSSSKIPKDTEFVRLVTYRNWSFTSNKMDKAFLKLLENLNISSLQYPLDDNEKPTEEQVKDALINQANDKLSEDTANVLLHNALMMGYVPMEHHLRHGGQTISWYRGPLVPYPVKNGSLGFVSCPDAANQYNPYTGMFDVSYGAAWQLGQLLALENPGYARALYNWKRLVHKNEVIQDQMNLLQKKLGDNTLLKRLAGISSNSQSRLKEKSEPPETVVDWHAKLSLLEGVPFQYLVPHEFMLPPESLRFFYIDSNWLNALQLGAFSIGQATTTAVSSDRYASTSPNIPRFTTTSGIQNDIKLFNLIKYKIHKAAKSLRLNPRPITHYINDECEVVTGILLRSQIVSGWKRLRIKGYADTERKNEIPLLKMVGLSKDTMISLFDGAVEEVVISEPNDQLRSGVEDDPVHNGQYITRLRSLEGANAGTQTEQSAPVPHRGDGQTLEINEAAKNIKGVLNPINFTSAEMALQMIKGMDEVGFMQNKQHQGVN